MDDIVLHFAELEGPCSTANTRDPLISVDIIAVMEMRARANGLTAMVR